MLLYSNYASRYAALHLVAMVRLMSIRLPPGISFPLFTWIIETPWQLAKRVFHNASNKSFLSSYDLERQDYKLPKSIARKSQETCARSFSNLTFAWLTPILQNGLDSQSQKVALHYIASERSPGDITEQNRLGILWQLFDTFTQQLLISAIYNLGSVLLQVLGIFALRYLLDVVSLARKPDEAGFTGTGPPRQFSVIVGFAIIHGCQSLAVNQSQYHSTNLGTEVRAALVNRLLGKTLSFVKNWESKDITTLLAVDVPRVQHACAFVHLMWVCPLQITIMVCCLRISVYERVLSGFVLVSVTLVLCILEVYVLQKTQNLAKAETTERVRQTQTALDTIEQVKLQNSTTKSLHRIKTVRTAEAALQQRNLTLGLILDACCILVPAGLMALVLNGSSSSSSSAAAYASIAMFNSMRAPLSLMIAATRRMADGVSSLSRIEAFLKAYEHNTSMSMTKSPELCVSFDNACFTWQDSHFFQRTLSSSRSRNIYYNDDDEGEALASIAAWSNNKSIPFALRSLNLSISHELIGITGPMASGKSSLLAAIAGHMVQTSGRCSRKSHLSLCAQEPWVEQTTIRNNILSGQPYDAERYAAVLNACAIASELAQLPEQDNTQIGEHGSTLSGGQLQRVNFARAVYRKADIYLLDDPCSALDSHTARHVLANVLGGLLKGKCVLLATQERWMLESCDRVLTMEAGQIIDSVEHESHVDEDMEYIFAPKATKGVSTAERISLQHSTSAEVVDGSQDWLEPWTSYFTAFRAKWIGLPLILMLLMYQSASILGIQWLGWSSSDDSDISHASYLKGYVTIVACQTCLYLGIGKLVALFSLRASTTIATSALTDLLYAKLSFFDGVTTGSVLEYMSKCVAELDLVLPEALRNFGLTACGLLCTLALTSYLVPLSCIAVMLLLFMARSFAIRYFEAASQIRHRLSLAQAAVMARFANNATGIGTIQVFNMSKHVLSQFSTTVDEMSNFSVLLNATQRWLAIRLDIICISLLSAIAIWIVSCPSKMQTSTAGALLTLLLAINQAMQQSVRQLAEVQTSMQAVRQLDHCVKMAPSERGSYLVHPHPGWPTTGSICLQNISLSYRPRLRLALHDVNFTLRGGERFGIVGRTGSGKSSIVKALTKLVDVTRGSITIDGININDLDVETLRSRICVVAQNPMVLEGTVRSILDPYMQYDYYSLNKILLRVGLYKSIQLQDVIGGKGGRLLSNGQKRLLCFAAGILKKVQIFVFDEVTSNVDLEAVEMVQSLIRERLMGKTVMTISHRPTTFLDYDRVLVMEHGQGVELGSPQDLLSQHGIFWKMCRDRSRIARPCQM